jgi:hypothetical protein
LTEAGPRRAPKKPLIQFGQQNKARGRDHCRTEAKLPHGYASQNPSIPHFPPTGKIFAAGSVTDCAEIVSREKRTISASPNLADDQFCAAGVFSAGVFSADALSAGDSTMGVSAVPSDHSPTGTRKIVKRS